MFEVVLRSTTHIPQVVRIHHTRPRRLVHDNVILQSFSRLGSRHIVQVENKNAEFVIVKDLGTL